MNRVFLLAFLIIGGCQMNTKHQVSNFKVEKIDLLSSDASDEALRLSEIINDFYFVKLKSTKKTGSIDKMVIHNDLVTIMDKQNDAIASYDMEGNEKIRIDQHGKGPGEFSRINSFTINPIDSSYLLNADFGRLMKFNDFGDYIGEVRLNLSILDIIATSENGLVIFTGFNDRTLPFAMVQIEIGIDTIVSKMLPCGVREFNSSFTSNTYFSRGIDEFLVIDQFNGEVYEFSYPLKETLKQSLNTKYILNFGEENLPKEVPISPRKNLSEIENYRFIHGSVYKAGDVLGIKTIKGTTSKSQWINVKPGSQNINSEFNILDNYLFTWRGGSLQCSNNDYFVNVHDGYDFHTAIEFYRMYLKENFPDKVNGFENFLVQKNLDSVGIGDEPVLTFFRFK